MNVQNPEGRAKEEGSTRDRVTTRTATQWGVYDVHVQEGDVVAVSPVDLDPDPSGIGEALVDTNRHATRIPQPMVRQGWLEARERGDLGGARERRGSEPFVAVSWERAQKLVADELRRVKADFDQTAIYAGSYGWASAGRFHHAQSQLHRFLNLFGGATRSMNSYSTAAAQVILPHVVQPWHQMEEQQTTWTEIAEGCELLVAFGGAPLKNAQVSYGGITVHQTAPGVARAIERGVQFVTIGPQRGDAPEGLVDGENHQWIGLRPGTDTAFMLGLAHELFETEGVDRGFLESHTVGWRQVRAYVLGESDGTPKSPEWAASICDVPAQQIRDLAGRIARNRTFFNAAWSLQRAENGEQPYWMLVTLAALRGDVGRIGGGFGFGYAAEGFVGSDWRRFPWATMPKGRNPTGFAIPVARIADMLLHPGTTVRYDGRDITYPEIEMIFWAGGNPFHHHQDLNRLVRAWKRPATVVVNEPWWTPIARHADVVFPATTAVERQDLCASSHDPYAHAMRQALEPFAQSRSDHEIYRGLAAELGFEEEFTEGRTEMEWIRSMWERSAETARRQGFELPEFDAFWESGVAELPEADDRRPWLADFRRDPEAHPLPTPSGKLELFSETIRDFGDADTCGHARWVEPSEWLGAPDPQHPLHLVSNQPSRRLHSQLDQSGYSQGGKVAGRERLRLHPDAAAARGIQSGDTVRVFNARGQCLAGAHVDDTLLPDVVELPTGAWFDPWELPNGDVLELAGNPNVLTRDVGTSSLAQGPSAHTCMVQVEHYEGDAPLPRVYGPPEIV